MQLLKTNEANYGMPEVICRQSIAKNFIASIILTGLFAGAPVLWWYLKAPGIVIWICTAGAVLVALLSYKQLINLFRSSNWTVAIRPDGLWINLRSYSNHRFEVAKTVLKLSYSEIVSAKIRIASVSASMSGDVTSKQKSIELKLANSVDTAQLKQAITEESRQMTPLSSFFGITHKGRSNHSPAILSDEHTLRIFWNGPKNCMSPNIKTALNHLSRYMQTLESVQEQSKNWEHLSNSQFDDMILEILIGGEKIKAIKLMRERTGMGLKQAKQAVENLLEQPN